MGADTTVVGINRENLGKPINKKEACKMMQFLQGRKHFVYTGYAIFSLEKGSLTLQANKVVRTDVYMKKLTSQEIIRYVNRGESMDKAGAYAAQGFGMALIEKISGSYTNVVGLPVAEVVEDLKKFGWKSNERTRRSTKKD